MDELIASCPQIRRDYEQYGSVEGREALLHSLKPSFAERSRLAQYQLKREVEYAGKYLVELGHDAEIVALALRAFPAFVVNDRPIHSFTFDDNRTRADLDEMLSKKLGIDPASLRKCLLSYEQYCFRVAAAMARDRDYYYRVGIGQKRINELRGYMLNNWQNLCFDNPPYFPETEEERHGRYFEQDQKFEAKR